MPNRRIKLIAALLLFGQLLVLAASLQEPEQALSELTLSQEEARLTAVIRLRNMTPFAREEVNERVAQIVGGVLRNDPSPVIRAAAAGVLGNITSTSATAALLASTAKEKQVNVRKAVAYALAAHAGDPATQALLELLRDKKAEVRGAAAASLAERNDPAAAAGLIEYIRKKDGDEDALGRSKAVRALGKMGLTAAREVILRALMRDKSGIVQTEAAAALGRIAGRDDQAVNAALRQATLSRNPYLVREAEAALTLISRKVHNSSN